VLRNKESWLRSSVRVISLPLGAQARRLLRQGNRILIGLADLADV
jgi:hypothetical protein